MDSFYPFLSILRRFIFQIHSFRNFLSLFFFFVFFLFFFSFFFFFFFFFLFFFFFFFFFFLFFFFFSILFFVFRFLFPLHAPSSLLLNLPYSVAKVINAYITICRAPYSTFITQSSCHPSFPPLSFPGVFFGGGERILNHNLMKTRATGGLKKKGFKFCLWVFIKERGILKTLISKEYAFFLVPLLFVDTFG